MEPGVKLSVDDSKEKISCPYREAIGCLNYVSIISRPDITFAVNKLARYSDKPKQVHWNAVKRVMRYLKGTLDHELTLNYTGSGKIQLIGNCDSDWEVMRMRGGQPLDTFSS